MVRVWVKWCRGRGMQCRNGYLGQGGGCGTGDCSPDTGYIELGMGSTATGVGHVVQGRVHGLWAGWGTGIEYDEQANSAEVSL